MLKKLLFVPVLLLICIMMAETASADYGYTHVSDIPMAVDFSFHVDFDQAGQPRIVTDYPFAATGATEMNLVYGNEENPEVFSLNYNPSTGVTRVGAWDGSLFGEDPAEEAARMIRDGKVSSDGRVYIGTSNYGLETDWVLVYSVGEKSYTDYLERTYAQAFNAMGNGGTEKSVTYQAGEIESARLVKRTLDADLIIEYSPFGDITYASVTRYGAETSSFDYDPSTGLFGGHPIRELGFDDADLTARPLAARSTRTETVIVSDPPAASSGPGTGYAVLAVSVLAGILIGLALFRRIHRRKSEPKELSSPRTDADTILAPEKKDENPPAAPAPEEYPEVKSVSSGH